MGFTKKYITFSTAFISAMLILISIEAEANPSSSQGNWCMEHPDKTEDVIDDLKKEVICLSDKNSEICHSLFFPNKQKEVDLDLSSINKKNEQTSCSHSNAMLPASTVNAIRLLKPVSELTNSITNQASVNSLEDFIHHTKLHKKRLLDLLDEAYKVDPGIFKGLTKNQMYELILIHDDEKIFSYSLRESHRPYNDDLWKGFGKEIDRSIIDEMNSEGHIYNNKIRERIGLTTTPDMSAAQKKIIQEQAKAATEIEKLLDDIDRIKNPITRLEYPTPAYPLTESQMKKYETVAKHLMDNYETLTIGNRYTLLNDVQRFNEFTKIRMQRIGSYLLGRGNKDIAKEAAFDLARGTTNVKGGIRVITGLLDTKPVKTGLIALDGAMLMATPSELGCSEGGIAPYKKDSNGYCYPAPGLSKEMSQFLLDPNSTNQIISLSNNRDCNTLKKTKELQDKKIESIKCGSGSTEISMNNGKNTIEITETNGKINNISFNQISDKKTDNISSVNIVYADPMVEKSVCFRKRFQKEVCYPTTEMSKMPASDRILYKAISKQRQELSYHIFNGVKSCEKKNSWVSVKN